MLAKWGIYKKGYILQYKKIKWSKQTLIYELFPLK